ncbi:AMP-binding protein [Paraburkholderia tropica]|uniref:Fatty-acyl-CoA synthase/long-chain acyl-CoA synthetase n=2 Tax=Paraburkholderia tropica TaxID=92647 RepID=A0ABX5MGZ5_9BURK|nr:AMP-binding protein [Paraburkholderia tropica]MDE1144278.1 AMP-binding protein [Paraburkholderia tropica]PXX08230.1 fatty-acyl-CoA synthase/long-chain acyl-CoA synthetase [Paraburkholderia tropica]PZW73586.1 fatty-acyl-CoA synthase/long-chain acyl-CoA synthetase [Paraburkholderia tropica]
MNEREYLDDLHRKWAHAWPADAPREPQYPLGQRPLTAYLREWARRAPQRPAVHFYGRTLSYGELNRLSDRCAALLASLGVQRGDRVAVFMPNCPQMHVAFYGILKLGAVHAPVSPLSKALELGYQLKDSGARVVICADQLLSVVDQVRDECTLREVIATGVGEMRGAQSAVPLPDIVLAPKLTSARAIDFLPALDAANGPVPDDEPQLDDIAALNYTGGTTGLPKGCIHTHGDMLYTCASFTPVALHADEHTVFLNFLPEFWIAGENAGLLFPVFAGAALVLLARWDALAWMRAVQHYRVTHCGMLVDSVADVLDQPNVRDFDYGSLQRVGAISFIKKLTPDYRRRWRELTGCTLYEFAYGMTETHTCDTFTLGLQDDDRDLRAQPTFVGLPVPGTEFKVCDFASGALLPPGGEGELCVRSPSLFKGYWQREAASADALRDGWLHTGDLATITEEGFIRYLGRRKEMLKVNGMSVFPSELEALLGQHPAIAGSAVIGKADAARGQQPVAFVVLKPGSEASGDELAAWCRASMAVYKVPEIRVIDALPMTATGKVRKQELDKLL